MPLLLMIDTSLEKGIVAIANEAKVLAVMANEEPMTHAAWLHTAMKSLLTMQGFAMSDIGFVAVASGPGSYTGLRIAMSAAKGLCFALKKPLLTISNLSLLAFANRHISADLYIPMIDARRDEVFTVTFDSALQMKDSPNAFILNSDSFSKQLITSKIVFCGNGSSKFRQFTNHPHAIFSDTAYTAEDMFVLATKAIKENKFANLNYCEPDYIKSVYFASTTL